MYPLRALPLLLAMVACKKDKSGDTSTTDQSVTAVTYNAGLAVGFVPGAESRAPQVADAVGALDADLVCLQEVWKPEHVAMFEEANPDAFPNTHFPAPSQETLPDPACADGVIDPLINCIDTNCADVSCTDELVDCLFAECPLDFLLLKDYPACMECVQANVGGTAEEVQATCESEHTRYAYGGSFGIGFMSPHDLGTVDEHVFSSTTNRRMVMHAVVDGPSGQFDAYCTHLTAVFDTIPYPSDTGSWAEEQAAQMTDMLSWIDSTKQTDRVLLLGDMNAGPAVGSDVVAEVPDNWAILAASGMPDPYADAGNPCTFCPDNPLTSEGTTPVIIDHILTDGWTDATSTERIFTEEITADRCGTDIPAALSDHYGVQVVVE